MAIRLRRVALPNGETALVALCAARTVEKAGDIYLDDAMHEALSNTFARAYNEMFGTDLPGVYDDTAWVEQEESNNPAREDWDKTFGQERESGGTVNGNHPMQD